MATAQQQPADGQAAAGGDREDIPRGWRFFLFASPQLALATLGLPIVIYLPAYYAGPLGLGLTATGFIFMAARFWDVFIDGVIGWGIDRFPTRWGRRKVWMLLATPLMVACTLAICFPPAAAGAAWLLVLLVLLYLWWAFVQLAHYAWAAELSDSYDQRSAILGRLQIVYFAGLLLVLTGPIIAAMLIGDASLEAKVQAMGLYTAVLLPVAVLAAVWAAREPPVPTRSEQPLGFLPGVRLALQNPALLRVLAVDLLTGLASGSASGLFVYVATDLFRLQGAARIGDIVLDPGLLLIGNFLGAFLGVPLWLKLSYRIGKHRAVAIAAVVAIAGFVATLAVPPGAFGLVALLFLINGFAFGAAPFLDRAILADVVEQDADSSGEQRTGFFFALMTMTNKIGYALPVGVLFPVLGWIGFNPSGGNSPQAVAWLAGLYVGVPVACNLAVIALMWNFPITRETLDALRARRSATGVA
jgi:Na+/melibiose symporter-like transporter